MRYTVTKSFDIFNEDEEIIDHDFLLLPGDELEIQDDLIFGFQMFGGSWTVPSPFVAIQIIRDGDEYLSGYIKLPIDNPRIPRFRTFDNIKSTAHWDGNTVEIDEILQWSDYLTVLEFEDQEEFFLQCQTKHGVKFVRVIDERD